VHDDLWVLRRFIGRANAGKIAKLTGVRLFVEILWIPRFTNFQRGITIVPESAISFATSLIRRMFSTRSSGVMNVVVAVMIAMGVVLYNQQVNTAIRPQLVDRPLLLAMLSISSCPAILASGKGLPDTPSVEQGCLNTAIVDLSHRCTKRYSGGCPEPQNIG